MNKLIKVSTTAIAQDAKEIEELVDSIPQLLSELESAMGELANCWEGVAWHTYQAKVDAYIEILQDIHKTMKSYTARMEQSSRVYHRADQDVCTQLKMLGIFC